MIDCISIYFFICRFFKARLPGCPEFCACKLWKNKMEREKRTRGKKLPQVPSTRPVRKKAECKDDNKSVAAKVKEKKQETPPKIKVNKSPSPQNSKSTKAALSTNKSKAAKSESKKPDAKVGKLCDKVKLLEAKMKAMTGRANGSKVAEMKEETAKRVLRHKHESEFYKLQRKYKMMQEKFRTLKKEQAMKSNLQNLQQKYKVLEKKFKSLKQKEPQDKIVVTPKDPKERVDVKRKEPNAKIEVIRSSKRKAINAKEDETIVNTSNPSKISKLETPKLSKIKASVDVKRKEPNEKVEVIRSSKRKVTNAKEDGTIVDTPKPFKTAKLETPKLLKTKPSVQFKCDKCLTIFTMSNALKRHTKDGCSRRKFSAMKRRSQG